MNSALVIVVALLGQKGLVDNVPPRIGYVYPPGARAGSTVDVMIGGYDWTPDMEVFVHDPRVKIQLTGPAGPLQMSPPPYWFGPKAGDQQPPLAHEVPARITLPADLPPGPVKFQVANANGGSPPLSFIVSDCAEVVEPQTKVAEPQKNRTPIQLPALPVAASGRISRITEIDHFHFTTERAGLTICRLDDQVGQPFNGELTICDDAGNLVADDADTLGCGAVVRFVAATGKKYSAAVTHLDHAGDRGYVYRLTMRQEPDVVATLPAVVSRGGKTNVEVVGWGVKTGANLVESVTKLVDPATCVPLGDERLGQSPRLRYSFDTPAGRAVATLAVAAEADVAEPMSKNAGDDIANRILTLPTRLTGAFDQLDEKLQMPVERYRLSAKKGEVFRLRAESIDGAAAVDPSIAVVAADGKEMARNDDLLVGVLNAALDFRCPADGEYEVIVADASGTVPSRALIYRLLVDNVAESVDFDAQVPELLNVPLGEQADLLVKTVRIGTWDEPIEVKLENLPTGITVPEEPPPPPPPAPLKPGQKPKPVKKPAPGDVKKTLIAAAAAAAGSRLAMVVAVATVGDRTIERRLGPVLVTAKMKHRAIVRSAVQDGGRLVNRGTTYPAEVFIDRYEGYTGPVTLTMSSTQSRQRRGIQGPSIVVPPGVDRALYPVTMPEWLETSLTARQNLMTVVETPDPKGNKRFVTGTMDGQIVMSIEGALLKITHEPQERRAAPGTTLEIPVKVSRTPKVPSPARVEIVSDADEPGLFTAPSLELPVNQSLAVLKVRIAENTPAPGLRHIVVRATVLQDGRWPAVSETRIPIILGPPTSVATAKK